jgi:hypothetical protein
MGRPRGRHRQYPWSGIFAEHGSRTSGPDLEVRPFAFRPFTAHDEEMGESCARCGRPGKPCSIHDPTISRKWIALTLCEQCHGAIRQMEVRTCKWFRRYCALEIRQLPFSRLITREPKLAKLNGPRRTKNGEAAPRRRELAPSHPSGS